jgi:hypothetical protein
MDMVQSKVVLDIRRWQALCVDVHSSLFDRNLLMLDRTRGELLRIAWR